MGKSPTPYFLSLAIRKIALRIIIISSLVSFLVYLILGVETFLTGDDGFFVGVVFTSVALLPLSVLLHHVLRLWPRKRWSVRSDFIYSAIEFLLVTGYSIAAGAALGMLNAYMIGFVAAMFLWCSVSASFVLTIWGLHRSQYRTFRSVYDFTANYDDTMVQRESPGIGRLTLAIGENIFRRRFGIDRVVVRGLRAAVSVLCFLGMVALGYLVLVIQPMQQKGYFQIMQDGPLDDLGYTKGNVTVKIAVDSRTWNPGPWPGGDDLDLDITWRPESQHVLCDPPLGLSVTCNVSSPFSKSSPDNLIVNINYTRALQQFSMTSLRSGVYLSFYTGTQRDNEVVPLPIQLYPGFHLFGTTFYSFREVYENSRDLAFGIPQFNRYLVANVQALIPDPEFANGNSDNTTATLRLTYQGGLSSVQLDHEVRREQSSSSVLSGFALLGGVWTSINGVFATLFGCQLMLVLFGIKPLSIYGLVHLFQGRRSLVDRGYTFSPEDQNRIIALLREHLLDDENGHPGIGKASRAGGQDETQLDGGDTLSGEGHCRTSDVSRKHLLGDDIGGIEAGDAFEERHRSIELSNLYNTVK